jgi:hypothetical protein
VGLAHGISFAQDLVPASPYKKRKKRKKSYPEFVNMDRAN